MLFLKKISNRSILLFSIIVIITSNEINTPSEFCSIYKYCSDCKFCGEDTNDYTSCSYYNLFCTEKLTNNTSFQESDIKKYSTFFRNIQDANNFCGQETYTIDSLRKSFTIINKSNRNINSFNINHCNYEIKNNKYYNNDLDIANLIIKLNSNNSNKNNLKLTFSILYKNSHSKTYSLITMSESDILNKNFELTLNDYQTIIILLDFNQKNFENNDEYLEIRIDTDNPSVRLNRIINILLIVVFTVLGLSIIASIIVVIYRRKINRDMNRILQQEELNIKQKMEKINKLFETILKPKEFNENEISNDCTECAICIEKFVNKCLICITPCKHIFHYECLKKLIETAKKKQKPIVKCPLCNYDFLEEKNYDEKLNIANNIRKEANNNGNNNEVRNENNNNEIDVNESSLQQNNIVIRRRVINVSSIRRGATSDDNLRNHFV